MTRLYDKHRAEVVRTTGMDPGGWHELSPELREMWWTTEVWRCHLCGNMVDTPQHELGCRIGRLAAA